MTIRTCTPAPVTMAAAQWDGSNYEEIRHLIGTKNVAELVGPTGFLTVTGLSDRAGTGTGVARPSDWVVFDGICVSIVPDKDFHRLYELTQTVPGIPVRAAGT